MRKKVISVLIAFIIFVFAFSIYFIFNRNTKGGAVRLSQGSLLHYKPEEYFIGDVHPYFNDGECYMYYLKPGNFQSSLIQSKDLLRWEEKKLIKPVPITPKEYFVLGVVKDGTTFRSFYGNGSFVGASHSDDLIKWSTSGLSYVSDINMELFPVGGRDPYVFFDKDSKVYHCVSTAYRQNKNWGWGDTLDCSIAISSTGDNTLTGWKKQVELKRFINGFEGEPECSQMFKIGNRWYLLASLASSSRNVHHVGKPSYWIGESNKGIFENNWDNKKELCLNGEDLCAAQVAFDGKKFLMWGWVPQNWSGNQWGGHLSLPLEVYALKDGTLATRLEKSVGKRIRGESLWSSGKLSSKTGSAIEIPGEYSRFDMEFTLDQGEANANLFIGKGESEISVEIDRNLNTLRIVAPGIHDGGYVFSSIDIDSDWSKKAQTVRVLAESDIIEVFLGDRYSLCARINRKLSEEDIRLTSSALLDIKDINIFRLKWLEET